MDKFMEVLVVQYGPIGFGLVALLILWKYIVKPSLDERRTDSGAFQTAAENMRAAAEASKDAANINRDTALILKAVTDRLAPRHEKEHEPAARH